MEMALGIILACISICIIAFVGVVITDAKAKKESTKYHLILVSMISFLEFLEFGCCAVFYGMDSSTIIHAIVTIVWTAFMTKIAFRFGLQKAEKMESMHSTFTIQECEERCVEKSND